MVNESGFSFSLDTTWLSFTGLSQHGRMIIQIVDLTIVYHQSAEEKRELFSRKTNQSQILS